MSGLMPPNPLSYEGQVTVPYINRTFPPTTSFNTFTVPTIWTDTQNKNSYILVNKALGVADWVMIGGTPGEVATLTGNSGGAVAPTAENINIKGDTTTINIVGNPGTSTLTASATGAVAISFPTGSGTATPALGALTIAGGTGISTTGAGSTATIILTTPVVIANGGTNATSFTNTDGVIYYDGTKLNSTTVGTAGQVLTSNGAAVAPTFQTPSAGVTGPGSSTNRAIATWNGTGGTALFNNSGATISSTGLFQNTSQTVFVAALGVNETNVTGDGTVYALNAGLSVNQQGTALASGVFTAPVTGYYQLCLFATFSGILISHTLVQVYLLINGTYTVPFSLNAPFSILASNGNYSVGGNLTLKLTAADTITANVLASGGAKVVSLVGAGTGGYTVFSGSLLC